jgi:hypothetical protein
MRTITALVLVIGFATGGCGQSVRRAPDEVDGEAGGTGGASNGGAGTGGSFGTSGGGGSDTGGSAGAAGASGAATGGNSSSAGTSGSGGTKPESTCASVTLTSEKPDPLPVVFVVDASESMNEEVAGNASSRWELTRDALEATFLALGDNVTAGVTYFPGERADDELCYHHELAVPIADVDSTQREGMAESLAAVVPEGPSPARDAYEFALEEEDRFIVGYSAIVLVTGGAPAPPMCLEKAPEDPWQEVLGSISHARQFHGTMTLVAGTWGSEGERSSLSQLANAGDLEGDACHGDGREFCHIDLTTGADLATEVIAALAPIRAVSYACDFSVPVPSDGTPPDLEDVRVTLTPSAAPDIPFTRFGLDEPCSGYGFQLVGDFVRLCPGGCGAVIDDPGASLTISTGCSSAPL